MVVPWALIAFLWTTMVWDEPGSVLPLAVLIFGSVLGAFGVVWMATGLTKNLSVATLIFTLYFLAGVVVQSFFSDSVILSPKFILVLLCFSPTIAITLYSYIARYSPTGGSMTFGSVPTSAPSGILFFLNCFIRYLQRGCDARGLA
jgi:hypothetical protein